MLVLERNPRVRHRIDRSLLQLLEGHARGLQNAPDQLVVRNVEVLAEAEPLGELGHDEPVGAGFEQGLDRLVHELDVPAPRPRQDVLGLEQRRHRQHDIRVAGRRRHEDVLHDDELDVVQALDDLPRVGDLGQKSFACHVDRPYRVRLTLHQILAELARRYALVSRVPLARHRRPSWPVLEVSARVVHPAAEHAHVSGKRGQVQVPDDGECAVIGALGAGHVLDDGRWLCAGVLPGHGGDGVGGSPRDPLNDVRRVSS